MAINQESFNNSLFDLLKTRGYNPVPIDAKGQNTPVPQDADVFKFDFKKGMDDNKNYGPVWATIDNASNLIIYYDDNIADSDDTNTSGTEFSDSWPSLLKVLKKWAMRRQLGFELKNRNHLGSDMAQREYVRKKEELGESYHPINRKTSYNDSIPTVKVILQHSKQLDENDKRYYNIEKIFVENTNGERFLLPTRRPGIAKVYARHVAEGGTPYDERGTHITSLVEEYTKMAGFVRAVRNGQFNESANSLINEGINHYNNLRETLSRMISQRGYNNYFESYTPVLNEEQIEESNINELFTKSTLDPRIENVLPILNKLNKNITEVKEANELEEWADKIVEGDVSEPNRYYTSDDVENFLKQFIQSDYMIPNNDAFNRYELIKAIISYIRANPQSVKGMDTTYLRDFSHQVATELVHRLHLPIREGEVVQLTPSDDELEGEFIGTDVDIAKPNISNVKEKYVSRYGDEWETYLLADLFDFLRQKNYPVKLRAKKAHEMLNKIDPTAHTDMPYVQFKESKLTSRYGIVVDGKTIVSKANHEEAIKLAKDLKKQFPKKEIKVKDMEANEATDLKSIPESELDEINFNILKKKPSPEERAAKAYDAARMPSTKDKFKQAYTQMRKDMGMDDNAKTKELVGEEGVAEESDRQFAQRMKKKAAQPPTKGMSQKEKEDKGWAKPKEKGVAEDLDANQKRVGQLGPTEPVGKNEKNLRGKLVGAESVDPEIRRLKKLSGV